MAGVLESEGQRRTGVGKEAVGRGEVSSLPGMKLQGLPSSLGQVLLSLLPLCHPSISALGPIGGSSCSPSLTQHLAPQMTDYLHL